ncbi:hypothetical protein [Streptomyces sp. NRRL S-87]|uniref:hypothetical protein n=1 Tax=Streptomyces sp. NRRL S-87 TaxID=1463920 RepID=UPI0005612272|nr:hypothetical protein [Streptomyces sp. NRRL S-87]
MYAELVTLAAEGDGGKLIPGGSPVVIPGLDGPVGTILNWALWLVVIAGVGGVIYGVFKLATSDKSRNGGGAEPFKWMGGGVAAILLSSSLITILNGIAGGTAGS